MDNKQNVLLYTGITCILAGIVFLLHLNNLLPERYFYEYVNVFIAIIFLISYIKSKNKIILTPAVFFFANGIILFVSKLLNTSSLAAQLVLLPGLMLLMLYITKRKSVILTIGSILTSWGVFLLIKTPLGIQGYYFSIGSLMLFTVLAFLLIWIIERQNWPILPILIFGGMGTYLIADSLGTAARNMMLQIACLILIVIGLIFIIKSLFNKHFEENE